MMVGKPNSITQIIQAVGPQLCLFSSLIHILTRGLAIAHQARVNQLHKKKDIELKFVDRWHARRSNANTSPCGYRWSTQRTWLASQLNVRVWMYIHTCVTHFMFTAVGHWTSTNTFVCGQLGKLEAARVHQSQLLPFSSCFL